MHVTKDSAVGVSAVRKGSTTDRILEAAKAMFLTAGYDGVNLDQVAERAGVARQTVYNRFGSKEAVFRAVMERHWAMLQFGDEVSPAPGSSAQPDPEVALRRFAASLVAFVSDTEQIAFTRLVIAESRHLPWVAEEFYQFGKKPLLASLTAILTLLTKAGQLDCSNVEIAAHQFLGLIQEFMVWPQVMAIPATTALPPAEVVIEEALLTFLSRYRHPRRRRGAR